MPLLFGILPIERENRQAVRVFSQSQLQYSHAHFHVEKVFFGSLYPFIITMYYCQPQEKHEL